jgi:hypothetical protein
LLSASLRYKARAVPSAVEVFPVPSSGAIFEESDDYEWKAFPGQFLLRSCTNLFFALFNSGTLEDQTGTALSLLTKGALAGLFLEAGFFKTKSRCFRGFSMN